MHVVHAQVDIAYQYLTLFLEDDDELASIAASYKAGTLTAGDMKTKLVDTLTVRELSVCHLSCARVATIFVSWYTHSLYALYAYACMYCARGQPVLADFQRKRALVTDQVLTAYTSVRALIY